MYCSNCKKTFPNDAAFCDTCGSRLENDPTSEAQSIANAAPAAQNTENPINQPTLVNSAAPEIPVTPVNHPNPGYQASGYQANPGYQSSNGNQTHYSQQSYNPGYYPPPSYSPQPAADNQVSTGKWIGIFLINIIPIVGPIIYLVMLFVWAFGSCKYPSLKSFSKAMLILMLIALIIGILVAVFLVPVFTEIMMNIPLENFEIY